jgi:hypothetical protein
MQADKDQESLQKAAVAGGGFVLSNAAKQAADIVAPGTGIVVGAATSLLPDRAKTGAAVGAMLGASAAGHIMSVGTAGAMAFGLVYSCLGFWAVRLSSVWGHFFWATETPWIKNDSNRLRRPRIGGHRREIVLRRLGRGVNGFVLVG